jgi:NTP pyrophosphatase (non-canonical NTP hydrolase)
MIDDFYITGFGEYTPIQVSSRSKRNEKRFNNPIFRGFPDMPITDKEDSQQAFQPKMGNSVKFFSGIEELVDQYQDLSGQGANASLYENLIFEEFSEWVRVEHNNKAAELKELADLVYVIFGYAVASGYDLTEAIERVHANNLARMRQDDGSIKRREDGKIIKNSNTPPVYLEDLA